MTKEQNKRYFMLCEKVNSKEISMNQAFKTAKSNFVNANGIEEGGFGGGFNDWLTHANNEGWIDKGVGLLNTFISNRTQPSYTAPPPPPSPPAKTSVWVWVGLGAVVLGGTFLIYKISKSK
tara:strand:+ start:418 stop:780 length:363 start_codon:yes stop_codon:yes gene_type:complete